MAETFTARRFFIRVFLWAIGVPIISGIVGLYEMGGLTSVLLIFLISLIPATFLQKWEMKENDRTISHEELLETVLTIFAMAGLISIVAIIPIAFV